MIFFKLRNAVFSKFSKQTFLSVYWASSRFLGLSNLSFSGPESVDEKYEILNVSFLFQRREMWPIRTRMDTSKSIDPEILSNTIENSSFNAFQTQNQRTVLSCIQFQANIFLLVVFRWKSSTWRNFFRPTPGIGQHKIHTNATTWHEALRICEEEGSYLAIINSRNESRAIAELAKSQAHVGTHNSNYVLVGFNDIDKEGEYVTVDGKSLTESGFVEWSRTEPNNQNGWHSENCGSVRKTDGKLNDIYCDKKYAFICEVRYHLSECSHHSLPYENIHLTNHPHLQKRQIGIIN